MNNDSFQQYALKNIEDELYSEEVQRLLRTNIKRGIYKELHQKSLLSDRQLRILLK